MPRGLREKSYTVLMVEQLIVGRDWAELTITIPFSFSLTRLLDLEHTLKWLAGSGSGSFTWQFWEIVQGVSAFYERFLVVLLFFRQVDKLTIIKDCCLSQIWHKSCSERCGSWRRHCNHRNSLDRWHDWTLSTVFLCLLCGRQYRRFRAAFCSTRPQRLLQDVAVKLLNEGPTIYSV